MADMNQIQADYNALKFVPFMDEEEIVRHFQLLTRDHNLLKDRACGHCKKENIRPPFLEILFWFNGDENYEGTCYGCGWHNGKKWREVV